ncbi:MAG: type II toxin-antitoxin system VapC family toxin [Terracidiphilus sp.]|jgi:predicted nucleic acid-binding protein
MMYLLDTNVVSEMRKAFPARNRPAKIDRHVQSWVVSVTASDLYLSAMTILELELGFLLLERRDPAQGALLRSWVRGPVLESFAGRILAVDVAIAQRCAALNVPNPLEDRDALIAATALVHGMTVVTRNVTHFQSTGVPIINPWD